MILILAACKPTPPEPEPAPAPPAQGLVLGVLSATQVPSFNDNGDRQSMLTALENQLTWLEKQPADIKWKAGDIRFGKDRLRRTLERFRQVWTAHETDPDAFRRAMKDDFQFYRFSWDGSQDVLITGYHAPIYEGSLTPTETFRYPIYARPKDMLIIDTTQFDPRQLVKGEGRRSGKIPARLEKGRVLPYYSREEIDEHGALKGRGLELVYLKDYFEAFSFHVQGGGFVKLTSGGFLKLAYAGQNGRPYTSIGRKLVDEGIIPEEKISMQAIEAYFAEKPEEVKRVCYANSSYVFYSRGRVVDRLEPRHFPPGVLGFPVTTRRSIATDKRYFPGGMPAYIEGVQRQQSGEPHPFGAFVIDQDTGGAIRENHIDFFQGAGDDAEHNAGLLKDETGRVTFFLIKQ
ncbi:MAG: murein transglycosylase A [Acidobacteriota bacterium]|nr:murein transglycosylase A [Acidobacteriota bacterium]